MKAARVHGAGDLRRHDEPVPTLRPGETLVRVTAVGGCGSDVHWWKEGAIENDRIKVQHRMKNPYPRATQLAKNGNMKLHSLVTHHFPLA